MTAPQNNGRIVVGVDGSPASADALAWAVRMARLAGGQVEALSAWEYPSMYGGGFGSGYNFPTEADWAGGRQKALDATIAEVLGDEHDVVTTRVVEGHPARVLRDAATGADLLVVGSSGHGGFSGLLLGSVSLHLVAHAPCPVVIVPHLAADQGRD